MKTSRRLKPPASHEEPASFGPPPSRRVDLACLAALWLAAACFYRAVLFQGMSLYLRDIIVFYYPQAHLIAEALRAGTLPSWEPAIGLGYPFHADPHSLVAYPLSWLLALPLSLPRAFNLFLTIHVPIAGSGFFLLLRRWRLGAPAAALGAAGLMFSGFTANLTCHALMLRGLAWLPFVLLAFDRFLESGSARALGLTALLLALESSATDPQYILFTVALLLAMPWLSPRMQTLPPKRRAGAALIAATLAGWMLAVQYVPLAQLVGESTRSKGVDRIELTHFQLDGRQLINLVVPVAFPNPADPDFSSSYPGSDLAFLSDIFFGAPLLALALASFAWFARTASANGLHYGRTVGTACLLAAGGFLFSFGDQLPFFPLLTTLVPPLALFRSPAKYFFFVGLAVPLLAALGFEGLLQAKRGFDALARRTLVGLALGLGLAILLVNFSGTSLARSYLARDTAGWAPLSATVERLADVWLVGLWEALGTALVAFLLVRSLARAGDRRRGLCLALGFGTILLLAVQTYATPAVAPDSFLSNAPRTAMLLTKIDAGTTPPRFMTHVPSGPLPFRASMTPYLRFQLGRELMTRIRGVPHGCNPLLATWAFDISSKAWLDEQMARAGLLESDRIAAACGATFSLRAGQDSQPQEGPDRLLGSVGLTGIWQLAGSTPRAFVASRVRRARAREPLPSLEALGSLATEVVIPEGASLSESLLSSSPGPVKDCRITHHGRDRLAVEFELEGRGLLVVLEQHYPGWHALVDGRERPIVEVAGLFRGVEVAAGERRLEMRYQPWSSRIGWLLSLAGLLVTLALVRRSEDAPLAQVS